MPRRRWHYRDDAVGFWSRAALLTDNENVRAAALYLAFRTLQLRYPDEADHYYKMLCDCRPQPLAQRAWQARWKFNAKDMPVYLELTDPTPVKEEGFAALFKVDPQLPEKMAAAKETAAKAENAAWEAEAKAAEAKEAAEKAAAAKASAEKAAIKAAEEKTAAEKAAAATKVKTQ